MSGKGATLKGFAARLSCEEGFSVTSVRILQPMGVVLEQRSRLAFRKLDCRSLYLCSSFEKKNGTNVDEEPCPHANSNLGARIAKDSLQTTVVAPIAQDSQSAVLQMKFYCARAAEDVACVVLCCAIVLPSAKTACRAIVSYTTALPTTHPKLPDSDSARNTQGPRLTCLSLRLFVVPCMTDYKVRRIYDDRPETR